MSGTEAGKGAWGRHHPVSGRNLCSPTLPLNSENLCFRVYPQETKDYLKYSLARTLFYSPLLSSGSHLSVCLITYLTCPSTCSFLYLCICSFICLVITCSTLYQGLLKLSFPGTPPLFKIPLLELELIFGILQP